LLNGHHSPILGHHLFDHLQGLWGIGYTLLLLTGIFARLCFTPPPFLLL
jgi:hypothetical protein